MESPGVGSGRRDGLVLLVTVAVLVVPFLGKAVHIDDPLFVWTARQILSDPIDFYGFEVNWYGTPMPMSEVSKNPPLASYVLAGFGAIFGFGEVGLHLASALATLLAALAIRRLARDLGAPPLPATLFAVLTPVFAVSATTLMCDMWMTVFWVGSILHWRRGIREGRMGDLALGSLAMVLAILTKYAAICLLPLLAAYAVLARRRLRAWLPPLLLALIPLVAYEVATRGMYGRGLLLDAVAYAGGEADRSAVGLLANLVAGFAFVGGGIVTVLLAPAIRGSAGLRATLLGLALAGSFGVALLPSTAPLGLVERLHWGVFLAGGGGLVWLVVQEIRRGRDPDAMLLVLWIAGVFLFATAANWTVNGRSLLPMVPAVGILLARRARFHPPTLAAASALFAPALAVTLAVSWGDAQLAASARRAADRIASEYIRPRGKLWFEGHWGFQYYMDRKGAAPIDYRSSSIGVGDVVVVPSNNTNLQPIPEDRVRWLPTLEFPIAAPAATMSGGAGFYASVWGGLPFVLGPVPPEEYRPAAVTQPFYYVPPP